MTTRWTGNYMFTNLGHNDFGIYESKVGLQIESYKSVQALQVWCNPRVGIVLLPLKPINL